MRPRQELADDRKVHTKRPRSTSPMWRKKPGSGSLTAKARPGRPL